MSFIPGLAIDPAFALFGKAARYVGPSGGAPVDCTILIDIRQTPQSENSSKAPTDGWFASVRASELAAPANGGVFTLVDGGKTYQIVGKPAFKDPDCLIYSCAVS